MANNRGDDWIEVARSRMAAKGKVKPSTKAGAVRALWPAIRAALDNGQSLKTIRDWLEEEGVHLTYNQFTSYVGRIRRRKERNQSAQPQAGKSDADPRSGASSADVPSARVAAESPLIERTHDPLANIRSREQRRPTFEYSPEFKEDDLI